MKEIIKSILDQYAQHSCQINLDSEAARAILSEQIAEKIKLWQNQKDLASTKKNEGWIKESATWRADTLRIEAL